MSDEYSKYFLIAINYTTPSNAMFDQTNKLIALTADNNAADEPDQCIYEQSLDNEHDPSIDDRHYQTDNQHTA